MTKCFENYPGEHVTFYCVVRCVGHLGRTLGRDLGVGHLGEDIGTNLKFLGNRLVSLVRIVIVCLPPSPSGSYVPVSPSLVTGTRLA